MTGGLLLSTAVAAPDPDPFFREHGRLAALIFGSAIGFLITTQVSAWPFRRKASLPLLAVIADGLILARMKTAAAGPALVAAVFGLLWARWALWFTSRSV